MENASKALLIAAAVLIVIVLIAFGMSVFNSAGDVSDDVTPTADWMSLKTTVAAIDVQFGKYRGRQKGTDIIRMLEEVAQYNKNSGNYVAGDNTTQLKRKISVSIDKKITGESKNSSNTDWDNILNYKTYFNGKQNEFFNVKAREYLDFDDDPNDGNEKKQAIYLITISK